MSRIKQVLQHDEIDTPSSYSPSYSNGSATGTSTGTCGGTKTPENPSENPPVTGVYGRLNFGN